eukprot:TRINITY_DN1850_c0_g1::TRINITY_DN1850_c0_g1_i1::g.13999::m.13999 TRINITY_DN1850_c0_g1::TRINITY_DN1850_c0_g1_i1::g.13999  ORF type:complete len:246 (+),score=37.18,TPR_6/PF13174.1/0.035,PPR_3/PF13812.1/67,PPR_3/PF13812.1/17 TRINITY_DN1850_c0_g1_i1:50-739(+)
MASIVRTATRFTPLARTVLSNCTCQRTFATLPAALQQRLKNKDELIKNTLYPVENEIKRLDALAAELDALFDEGVDPRWEPYYLLSLSYIKAGNVERSVEILEVMIRDFPTQEASQALFFAAVSNAATKANRTDLATRVHELWKRNPEAVNYVVPERLEQNVQDKLLRYPLEVHTSLFGKLSAGTSLYEHPGSATSATPKLSLRAFRQTMPHDLTKNTNDQILLKKQTA